MRQYNPGPGNPPGKIRPKDLLKFQAPSATLLPRWPRQ